MILDFTDDVRPLARWYPRMFVGTRIDNEEFILKRLHPARDTSDAELMARNELVQTKHAQTYPNVVRCFGEVVVNDTCYMVLEYMRGGDLRTVAATRGRTAPVQHLFSHVAECVVAMHRAGFVHRDIKLANILVSGDFSHAVLADFEYMVHVLHGQMRTDRVGTVNYQAPEIVFGQPYCPFAADMWALGVVLYALAHGEEPFIGRTAEEVRDQVLHLTVVQAEGAAPAEQRNLVERLLDRNVATRMTATELRAYAWCAPHHDVVEVSPRSRSAYAGTRDLLRTVFSPLRSGHRVHE